jgi:hypothetical protein
MRVEQKPPSDPSRAVEMRMAGMSQEYLIALRTTPKPTCLRQAPSLWQWHAVVSKLFPHRPFASHLYGLMQPFSKSESAWWLELPRFAWLNATTASMAALRTAVFSSARTRERAFNAIPPSEPAERDARRWPTSDYAEQTVARICWS